jgi:hypothetical protein
MLIAIAILGAGNEQEGRAQANAGNSLAPHLNPTFQ